MVCVFQIGVFDATGIRTRNKPDNLPFDWKGFPIKRTFPPVRIPTSNATLNGYPRRSMFQERTLREVLATKMARIGTCAAEEGPAPVLRGGSSSSSLDVLISPIVRGHDQDFCVRSNVYRTIGVLEGPGERRYEPSLPWSGTKTRRCKCASFISNKCIVDTPRNETCKATFERCTGRGPADRHMRNGGGPKGRWRKAWIGTDDVLSILCHAAMDGP